MLEIKGNIWKCEGIICVTTNGILNKAGNLVMGKGIALEAKIKFPELPAVFGQHVKKNGNIPFLYYQNGWPCCLSFPTKHHWKDKSDLQLIKNSAKIAQSIANELIGQPIPGSYLSSAYNFYMSRPGCGNGHLNWNDVKPVIADILSDQFIVVSNEE